MANPPDDRLAAVLGSYPDLAAGSTALASLRKAGLKRSGLITRAADGRVRVRNAPVSPWQGAVGAGLVALALAALVYVVIGSLPVAAVDWGLLLLFLAVSTAAGWDVVRRLEPGVQRSTIATLSQWVLPQETLVVAEAPGEEARAALSRFAEFEGAQPATFIVRPQRETTVETQLPPKRERYSGERLRTLAAQLASQHAGSLAYREPAPLLARLDEYERLISAINLDLTQAVQLEQSVSISAEWLLDNTYIIQRHIADVQRNLPHAIYRELPVLTGGRRRGEPRAYDVAAELIASTDDDLSEADIVSFLDAYQKVSPLDMSELWALPQLLRLALVESLSDLAVRISEQQHQFEWADFWSSRVLVAARRAPEYLLAVLAELARQFPDPSTVFADRLISQLQGESFALGPVMSWLELRWGRPVHEAIMQGERRHASDQVTVANGITTLRMLTSLDWREVFENVSVVDAALRGDPAGVYQQMDFGTRDLYRHGVEQMARSSRAGEVEVAHRAVSLATAAGQLPASHVGYFIVGPGRVPLERDLRCRPPAAQRLRRLIRSRPTAAYLGSVGVLTAAVVIAIFAVAARGPSLILPHAVAAAIVVILAAVPATEIAVQIANFFVSLVFEPAPLPKLSFEDGIADEYRTLVGVPVLFTAPDAVRDELVQLEIRYLANPDPNLSFALLGDLVDAPERDAPGDPAVLAAVAEGVAELNSRHPTRPFLAFCRARRWNNTEGVWMGWERKRGKLEELNGWLMGDQSPSGSAGELPKTLAPIAGDSERLRGVRFVVTLDADTQLPHGAAHRLVGCLAHPLNRPVVSADGRKVVGGYTVVQPRVSSSLPSAIRTNFSRLFADTIGVDPYTHVVFDLYQDLAEEGSYYGKGIYDVQVFHDVLGGRFPDSTLLSHDMIEGAFVRVGSATDVELYDAFPSRYETFARRQHRWIRGDWQIANWLLPRIPEAGGRWVPNPLSWLNRWKLLDNLRRSVLAPLSIGLLAANWLFLPDSVLATSVLVLLTVLLTPLLHFVLWLAPQPGAALSSRLAVRDQAVVMLRAAVSISLLPSEAGIALDAIARALYRRLISKRQLLEWQTFRADGSSRGEHPRVSRRLGLATVGAIALLAVVAVFDQARVFAALPFLLLWMASPYVIIWLDQPRDRGVARPLSRPDRRTLRRLARETWRYFDDFVGPATSWLPPDNYQEAYRIEVAERTSPTNVGLWLLSALAAHDLGYITLDQAVERAEATLETIGRLERHEGHLLNWYDTRTLEPLNPRYVSTVDSGNLIASLWALAQGLREALEGPVIDQHVLAGLEDTLELALVHDWSPASLPRGTSIREVERLIRRLRTALADRPSRLPDIVERVRSVAGPARELADLLGARLDGTAATVSERTEASLVPPVLPHYWFGKLDQQASSWLDFLDRYLPWADELSSRADKRHTGAESLEIHELRRRSLAEMPSIEMLARGSIATTAQTPAPQGEAGTTVVEPAAEQATVLVLTRSNAWELKRRIDALVDALEGLAASMDLSFLYDARRRLFAIGYNVTDRRFDPNHYDLLASEARLASFVAAARGDVPVEHWFVLGRPFGLTDNRRVLFSWSGTMFEYLMPLLYTRAERHTLLEDACREAVAVQIEYGRRQHAPWGISEAAFAAVDVNQTYQYQAFGVPGLGLKRGLGDDLVVAPYATALALLVDPQAAVANFRELDRLGLRGTFGYCESVDFTRRRLPPGRQFVVIQAYMAHHQGMTLLALDSCINRDALSRRFRADHRVRAAQALLFERVPTNPVLVEAIETGEVPSRLPRSLPAEPVIPIDAAAPAVQILGNGEYTALVTSTGGGFGRWRGLDVSRWQADTTLDAAGSFVYVRDVESGEVWSTTYQPTRRSGAKYTVRFTPNQAEFARVDRGIGIVTTVTVPPDGDVEIRRVAIVNHSNRERQLELTSYVELALASHAADRAHPAFSKLFVQTSALPEGDALLAHRKRRSESDPEIWGLHVAAIPAATAEASAKVAGFETDRRRFIGRARRLDDPAAIWSGLSGTVGDVLDPIFSIRCQLDLPPGERLEVAFVTGAAESRQAAISLVEEYRSLHVANRAFETSNAQAQALARQLRVNSDDLHRFRQLVSSLLYPAPQLRASEWQVRRNRLGQSGLWAYGISGDLPIMLVTVGDRRDADLVSEALLAHSYWRHLGLRTDLVILNEEAGGYEQRLQADLRRVIQRYAPATPMDQPGGIFLRTAEQIPDDDLTLLYTVARAALVAARGPLSQQLGIPFERPKLPPPLPVRRGVADEPSPPLPFLELPYFNGLGGFTQDGREYAIYLGPGTRTPAPWVNILASPTFGTLVSESGQGFSWFLNSQSNRIVPWNNDPVSPQASDVVYVRDEDLGVFWTPTAAPIRELDAYRARHGQGYSIHEHNSHALEQELVSFVPMDDSGGAPVKIQRLRVRNRSSRRRTLSVYSYADWVLGTDREETQQFVATSWDPEGHVLLARNTYHPDFRAYVAFASASPSPDSFTADRTEFLGRNGSYARPAALGRQALTGNDGAGLDPCAALQVTVEVDPGQTADVCFMLGQAEDTSAVQRIVERFRDPVRVEEAFRATRQWWDRLLSVVEVETPVLSANLLLNRWLLYQALSCRIWGRSAFYQSGGAIGFRDQLQDSLALLYARPDVARAQIIAASAHQFVEGDVQHWWHPRSGLGVRTRISDDLLWLPYAVSQYIRVTGDRALLDEGVPFLEGRVLAREENEALFVPNVSLESRSVLEHCRRAIAKGLTSGPHGLPLIGTGDWNDGLNLVGVEGRGESVWLAWFLIDVLNRFAEIVEASGLADEAEGYRLRARDISKSIENAAWDGEWYRRAYYDDGTSLGSRQDEEMTIDSIAQSWAAISGAGDPERTAKALSSAEALLVRDAERLILLFTPPFEHTEKDPGYIKGYPAGVRENGGQYTHGALWLAQAFATIGDGDRAGKLLDLLNPVERAKTLDDAERYRVEPYVATADVYSLEGHVGMGGWSWYTGSAGWMYRIWIEDVLGLKVRGGTLRVEPTIPSTWPGYTVHYRSGGSTYHIRVENPDHVCRRVVKVEQDGAPVDDGIIRPVDDGREHWVSVWLGRE